MGKNTLFTVGPVQMDPKILAVAGQPLPYFRTDEFSDLMKGIEADLLRALDAPASSRLISLTSSGTGAMEASVANLFGSQDRVLVIRAGTFGQRFEQICTSLKIPFETLEVPFGEDVTAEMLEPFSGKRFQGVLMNGHETSTGVLLDVNLVATFAHRQGALLVCDAISTFLTDPFSMTRLEVDVAIISSHKALGLHPGMSFVAMAPKAIERNRIRALTPGVPFYFDFGSHLQNGLRGQTPWTPAVSIILQLRTRLDQIAEFGVQAEIDRHHKLALDFRKRIAGLPLSISSKSLSNCLTPLQSTDGTSAYEIFQQLENNHAMTVLPSGGNLKDKLFRVGHLGFLTLSVNERLATALKQVLVTSTTGQETRKPSPNSGDL